MVYIESCDTANQWQQTLWKEMLTSVSLFTFSHTYQNFVVIHKGCMNYASGSKPQEPAKLSLETSMKQYFIAVTPTQGK